MELAVTEFDLLTPDPADDQVLYPRVQAWAPTRRAGGFSGAARRESAVRSARFVRNVADAWREPAPVLGSSTPPDAGQAESVDLPVSLSFPRIDTPSANLVSQSAFLRPWNAQPSVTQGRMESSVQPDGVSMQKPAFFSSSNGSGIGQAPLAVMPKQADSGLTLGTSGAPDKSGFFNSSLPATANGERLSVYGQRWLKSLPVSIRPLITAKRHPHIVNKFSILWGDIDGVNNYFDDLLISSRPGRRGFATPVLDELVELQRALQERPQLCVWEGMMR